VTEYDKVLDAMTATLAKAKESIPFALVGVATSEGFILVALGTEWKLDEATTRKLRDDMAELIRKVANPTCTMVRITNPDGQA
jgi:hypothetical protein